MLLRDATQPDWAAIWPFWQRIVAAGQTYSYDRGIAEGQARDRWMLAPPGRTVVAVDDQRTVLGTAKMHPNHGGPAAHGATASFMVDPSYSGMGVGRALGEDALIWARHGGRAMQFTAVVETNTGAVRLWRSLGFEVLTTVPEAFHHPAHGFVGLHIMHRFLR